MELDNFCFRITELHPNGFRLERYNEQTKEWKQISEFSSRYAAKDYIHRKNGDLVEYNEQ